MTAFDLTAPYFAQVPRRRLAIVSRLTFGYAALWLLVRVRYIWDVASLPARRFDPIGVIAAFDAPPDRWIVMAVWVVGLAACAGTAFGRIERVAAPVAALAMLFVATVTSSFGQIFHTEHLLVLHLVVLAAGIVIEPADGDETSGWPLRLMMAVTVAVYVVAGVAKLRYGDAAWITGDVLRGHVAADNLRKLLLDDWYSPLGGWLAGIGWLWPPVATLTILVELGAPVALVPGRLRYGWVALAWAFHVGVLMLMAISFPYQLLGVAYLSFLPVERVEAAARQRWLRRSGMRGRARTAP